MPGLTVTITYMCGHCVIASANQGGFTLSGLQHCTACGGQDNAVLASVQAVPGQTRTA